jgi:hypothetical protein
MRHSRTLLADLTTVVAASRTLCERSRRLFPRRIRGASDADRLIESIRAKVDAGLLPRKAPAKVWGGRGTGASCAGCDRPIQPDQIEYEFVDRQGLRMHRECALLWRNEPPSRAS